MCFFYSPLSSYLCTLPDISRYYSGVSCPGPSISRVTPDKLFSLKKEVETCPCPGQASPALLVLCERLFLSSLYSHGDMPSLPINAPLC